MPLTFPLTQPNLNDLLPVESIRFRLARVQDVSGLGNGDVLVADFNSEKWIAEIRLAAMTRLEAGIVETRIEALQGGVQKFRLVPVAREYPYHDPDGSILGAATPLVSSIHASRRALAVKDLPAGYALTWGDWFHYDIGGRRHLHRLAQAGTGATTIEMQVVPMLAAALVADTALDFTRPAGLFRLMPGSWQPGDTVNTITRGASLTAVESRV